MPLDGVEPQKPIEMPIQHGTHSGDLTMTPVNKELPTDDGDVTKAQLEAYNNCAVPGIAESMVAPPIETHSTFLWYTCIDHLRFVSTCASI